MCARAILSRWWVQTETFLAISLNELRRFSSSWFDKKRTPTHNLCAFGCASMHASSFILLFLFSSKKILRESSNLTMIFSLYWKQCMELITQHTAHKHQYEFSFFPELGWARLILANVSIEKFDHPGHKMRM